MISTGRGGRRHLPLAFTEQGVAMLSSVLRSRRAVLVNFDALRELMTPQGSSRKRIGFRAE